MPQFLMVLMPPLPLLPMSSTPLGALTNKYRAATFHNLIMLLLERVHGWPTSILLRLPIHILRFDLSFLFTQYHSDKYA